MKMNRFKYRIILFVELSTVPYRIVIQEYCERVILDLIRIKIISSKLIEKKKNLK